MFGSHVDNSSKIIVQIWAGESDIGNKDERWFLMKRIFDYMNTDSCLNKFTAIEEWRLDAAML